MRDSIYLEVLLFTTLAVALAVMGHAIRGLGRTSLWSEGRRLDAVILYYSAVLLTLGALLAFNQKALCWL
jgi:hypothetical protein